jgi:hypothetical protein
MNTDLIAKWTTDILEVKLITSLQGDAHPQYRNGVIRVLETVPHGALGTFLIMPRYTPLELLPQVTATDYGNLRLKLVEVSDDLIAISTVTHHP